MKNKKLIITLACVAVIAVAGGSFAYAQSLSKDSIPTKTTTVASGHAIASTTQKDKPEVKKDSTEINALSVSEITRKAFTEKINNLNLGAISNESDLHTAKAAISNAKIGLYDIALEQANKITNKATKHRIITFIDWAKQELAKNHHGQLTELNGISKDIYNNTKYLGISDTSYPGYSDARGTKTNSIQVKFYNPNILTKKTFIDYYKKAVLSQKDTGYKVFLLKDIYNPNYGFFLSPETNKNLEFNYGNISCFNMLVDNANAHYAGVHGDKIVSYFLESHNFDSNFPLK